MVTNSIKANVINTQQSMEIHWWTNPMLLCKLCLVLVNVLTHLIPHLEQPFNMARYTVWNVFLILHIVQIRGSYL